jgi:hypothetical protein
MTSILGKLLITFSALMGIFAWGSMVANAFAIIYIASKEDFFDKHPWLYLWNITTVVVFVVSLIICAYALLKFEHPAKPYVGKVST